MKRQWSLILAFALALVVAVFAVVNVEPVSVDYVLGKATWPLILVILGSVVMGAFIIGMAGMFRYLSLKRELKLLKRQNQQLLDENHTITTKVAEETLDRQKDQKDEDPIVPIEKTPSLDEGQKEQKE